MEPRRILFADVPDDLHEALRPLVSREGFLLRSVTLSPGVMDIFTADRWRLVVIGVPVEAPPLGDILRAIRRAGSPAREASVILAGARDLPQVSAALEAGANRLLDWPGSADAARAVAAGLLEIAPRRGMRVMAKLQVVIATRTKRFACQSIDISQSGILLRAQEEIEVGTEADLEFSLPGDNNLIQVRARVVRRTRLDRERAPGVGLRFERFPDPSLEEKIVAFCSRA